MLLRPHFLVNPAAASGRARQWWAAALPVLQRAFPEMTWAVSELEPLSELARAAVAAGNTLLVGVGGDGTHHDIVNGLVTHQLLEGVTYAPLPLGSGNDWCRTLGVPRHIVRWIAVMKQGHTIHHRIGRLSFSGQGSAPRLHYFINVAGLAYDAEVVRRSATLRRKYRWMYPLLTVAYLKDFTPPTLRLSFDDNTIDQAFHTINVGLGRYNGGGMRLVPQADPRADTLALTYAEQLPVSRILANGWRFYTPTIGKVRGVTTTHARSIRVDGPTGVEADGEWLGTAPVGIDLYPERLRVLVGLTFPTSAR